MSGSLLPLPAGWLHCDPPIGSPVASSNFILVKAPLSASKYALPSNNNINAHTAAFTPQSFLDSQQSQGRRVRYLIEISARSSTDLTPTRRPDESQYYDPAVEITPHGATFMHFQVQLTRPIPTSDPTQTPCPIDSSSIASFVTLLRGLVATCEREAAAEERKKAKAEKQTANAPAAAAAASETDAVAAYTPSLPPFIYLHDLYGFNLAGFMLACYLVEEQGFDVMSAVNDIADSRPPGIYISSLFQALVNRYFAKEQIAEGVPEKDIQIPVIPDLPRPDFHEVPWTGIVPQKAVPSNAADGTNSSSGTGGPGAAEEPADAGEEKFKRKARKKPNAAAPVAMSDGPSVSSTPAPSSSVSSSSSTATSSTSSSLAGSKRPFEDVGSDSNKRSKPPPPVPTNTSWSSAAPSISTSFTPSAVTPAPASVESNYIPRVDVAKVRKDHPYLIPLQSSLIEKLTITLNSLMPSSQLTSLRLNSVFDALDPTPLNADSLSPINSASYSVSWLPVSHQCLMLVLRDCVYLVFGPKEWFLIPQVQFPKRKLPTEFVNSTLAVGELILDPLPNAPSQSRFLATDLLVMAQTNLLPILSHDKRMQALEVELIVPLKQHREKNGLLPSVQFNIRNKMQFALAKIDSAINMQVGHGNAGVEFMYKGNIEAGAQPVVYKYVWKKADACSSAVSQTMLLQLAQK